MRIGIAALVLLSLAACARQLDLAAEPWLELKSDNFTLRTDVSEDDARATLLDLEQTRSVYLRAFAWGGEPPSRAQPFEVVEVAALVELHEFSRPELAGFVAPLLGGQLVVVTGEESTTEQPTLKHELAHAVARQLLRSQPAWFAEGLACFLENTHREASAGRDIVGELDQERVDWLGQHTVMPAEEILSTPSAVSLDDREGARFESSAYELFFMLFNQRRDALAAYMRRLARGDEPAQAFAAVFPDLTPARLDELILDSQRTGVHYTKLGVPLLPYTGAIEVRRLAPAEVHLQLGTLFALSPGIADRTVPRQRAQAELAQALALDPGNPQAEQALLSLSNATPAQWLEAARRSVELHPDSWRAQLLLVEALGAQPSAEQAQAGAAGTSERLAAARRAAYLAPDEPAVLVAYASQLAQHQQSALGLAVAQRAVALDPSSANALAELARQLGLAHRPREGLASLQRAMEHTSEHAPRRFIAWLLTLQKQLDNDLHQNPPSTPTPTNP